MKRQLKKSVIYGLYGISFAFLVIGIVLAGAIVRRVSESTNDNYQYVSKGILDYEEKVPVVNTEVRIVRPYTDGDVKLVKSFYDYKAS